MSASKKSPRSNKPSIGGGRSKLEGAYFELADFVHDHEGHVPSSNVTKDAAKAELKSPEILTTKALISAAGQLWNRISPPDVLEPKARVNRNYNSGKNIVFGDLGGGDIGEVSNLRNVGDGKRLPPETKKYSASGITTMAQPKIKFLRTSQKLSVLEPCSENFTRTLFQKFSKEFTVFSSEASSVKRLQSVGISFEWENIYGWMKEILPLRSQHPINVSEGDTLEKRESSIAGITFSDGEGCTSKDTAHPDDKIGCRSVDSSDNSVRTIDNTISCSPKVVPYTNRGTGSSLYSDYFLGALGDNKVNGSVSSTISSDYHIDYLASYKGMYEEIQHNTDDNQMSRNNRGLEKHFIQENSGGEMKSLQERPQYSPPKREHAFAGAFAGIFVSLFLHPVDTIKTIVQSCHAEQKSIYHIGRSIISERGVTGLYRGISSNIASSAPISAIYTFTYESVKGSLLPLIPKEYQSVAHCIAGGCASIATSFVFTPSERIKQQMQIGSQYHNIWNAFVGIIQKGGMPSLYTGWGAVLCRNIPHSIIKFYTYESLKQWMLSSQNSSKQLNTVQTLVCGGIAGSTAALFTTPFDVVKTRLQTQIPGSMSKYDGVLHALLEIGKREGLKGLSRGLMPRLVMYVSQGALFFASYESFKRLFQLEMPQINASSIQDKENEEDEAEQSVLSS